MYNHQDHCNLCGEAFSKGNSNTLNHINNSIGNTQSDCKLVCDSNNTLYKRDEDPTTRFYIGFARYC